MRLGYTACRRQVGGLLCDGGAYQRMRLDVWAALVITLGQVCDARRHVSCLFLSHTTRRRSRCYGPDPGRHPSDTRPTTDSSLRAPPT